MCVLEEARDAPWMQEVAREMNLSETAFLVERSHRAFDLRWFTPTVEVPMCGHATLASAHILYETGRVAPDDSIEFSTQSGVLGARHVGRAIALDFPAIRSEDISTPDGADEALGIPVVRSVANDFYYMFHLESEDNVRTVTPNLSWIASLPTEAVIVTSHSEQFDFVSRFFGPRLGIPEDPVTGSAHCALGPYWSELLGKNDLVGYQASARGGIVRVNTHGDRVDLIGSAVTVFNGTLAH